MALFRKKKLNAGNAVRSILPGDPAKHDDDLSNIALFRDPRTGNEMARAWFDGRLSQKFDAAGFPQFKGFSYSLRISGATTPFTFHGEAAVTALYGLDRVVMYQHLHLSLKQRLSFSKDMATASSMFVPERHLPIERT